MPRLRTLPAGGSTRRLHVLRCGPWFAWFVVVDCFSLGFHVFALSFSWVFLPSASDSPTSSTLPTSLDLLLFLTLAWVARLSALILLLHVLFSLSISPLVRLLSHHSKGSPIDSPSFFGEALRLRLLVRSHASLLGVLVSWCLVVSISLNNSRSAAHPILDVPCIRFRTCCVTQKNSDGEGLGQVGSGSSRRRRKKRKA